MFTSLLWTEHLVTCCIDLSFIYRPHPKDGEKVMFPVCSHWGGGDVLPADVRDCTPIQPNAGGYYPGQVSIRYHPLSPPPSGLDGGIPCLGLDEVPPLPPCRRTFLLAIVLNSHLVTQKSCRLTSIYYDLMLPGIHRYIRIATMTQQQIFIIYVTTHDRHPHLKPSQSTIWLLLKLFNVCARVISVNRWCRKWYVVPYGNIKFKCFWLT